MRKALFCVLIVIMLSLPVFADNVYERPRVRTVTDVPLISGTTRTITAQGNTLLNSTEPTPNSNAFNIRKGTIMASNNTRIITQKSGRSIIVPAKRVASPVKSDADKTSVVLPDFKPTPKKGSPTNSRSIIDPLFKPTARAAKTPLATGLIIDPAFKPTEKKTIVDPSFRPQASAMTKPIETKGLIDPTYKPGEGKGATAIIDPTYRPTAKSIKTTSVSVPLRTLRKSSAITGAAIAVPQKSQMLGPEARAKYNAKAQTFTGTWSGSQEPWEPHVGKKVRSIDLVTR